MDNCLFCKIIRKEINEEPIWENEQFCVYLDRNPNTEGVVMVIPKKHFDSYVFDMPESDYIEFLKVCKTVAKTLEKVYKVKRVAMVMEGLGINHAHIKLYPIHGLEDKFKEIWAKDRVYFKEYPGYITTQMGEELSREKLLEMAQEFKHALTS